MDKTGCVYSLVSTHEEVLAERYSGILARIIALEEREEKQTRHIEAVTSAVCRLSSQEHHWHRQQPAGLSDNPHTFSTLDEKVTRCGGGQRRYAEKSQYLECTDFVRKLILKVDHLEERLAQETQKREVLQESLKALELGLARKYDKHNSQSRCADVFDEATKGGKEGNIELRIRSIVNASLSEFYDNLLLEVKSLIKEEKERDVYSDEEKREEEWRSGVSRRQQKQHGLHSLSLSSTVASALMGSHRSGLSFGCVAPSSSVKRLEALAHRRLTCCPFRYSSMLGQKGSYSEVHFEQKQLPPVRTRALSLSQSGGECLKSSNRLSYCADARCSTIAPDEMSPLLAASFFSFPCYAKQKQCHGGDMTHENIFVAPHEAKARNSAGENEKSVGSHSPLPMTSLLAKNDTRVPVLPFENLDLCGFNNNESDDQKKDDNDGENILESSASVRGHLKKVDAYKSVKVGMESPTIVEGKAKEKRRERPQPLDKDTLEDMKNEMLKWQVLQMEASLAEEIEETEKVEDNDLGVSSVG